MIEERMQVCNRNFTQSTELVSLESLYLVLVLFLSHCISLICSFPGDCCYPEHGLLASRILDPTEGGGEATSLRLIGVF